MKPYHRKCPFKKEECNIICMAYDDNLEDCMFTGFLLMVEDLLTKIEKNTRSKQFKVFTGKTDDVAQVLGNLTYLNNKAKELSATKQRKDKI